MSLAPIVIPAIVKQSATIIFLHGLGDNGYGCSELLQTLRPPYAKIICPNARERPVTINKGFKLPAWFDLLPLDQPKDVEGIQEASKLVQTIIQTEVDAGIQSSRVVLGGFSQGGALALYTGLTGSFLLPGILALSTWLPIDKNISWNKVHKPRILQCHGEEDMIVTIGRARKTARILQLHLPSSYSFKEYSDLDHDISHEQELKDIKTFLSEVIPQVQEVSKL